MIKLSEIMLFSDNFVQAYEKMCQLLCREFQIPQTAFDILMFLSNNPQYHTASDIVHLRKIKPNLVSFHVEKLVRERFGVETFIINYVGPTIGAHSGPGTMALFFMGNPR